MAEWGIIAGGAQRKTFWRIFGWLEKAGNGMRGKRKESLTQFNKSAIMQEANDLFCRKGFAGTSMDDIARESGYSRSTIYAYFKSKEDILAHMVAQSLEMIRDKLQEITETHEDGEAYYLSVCDMLIELHERNPVQFAGLVGKIPIAEKNVSPDIARRIDDIRGEIHALLMQRFARSSRRGALRAKLEPLEMVYLIWCCIYGIIDMSFARKQFIEKTLGKPYQDFMKDGMASLLRLVRKTRD